MFKESEINFILCVYSVCFSKGNRVLPIIYQIIFAKRQCIICSKIFKVKADVGSELVITGDLNPPL